MQPIRIDNRTQIGTVVKKRIPMKDILAQHRKRWKMECEAGDVIAKRINHVDLEDVTLMLVKTIDGYFEAVTELKKLQDKGAYAEGLDAEQTVRFMELAEFLKQYANHYAIRCMVEPACETVEEFDALVSVLTAEERDTLFNLLTVLIEPKPRGEVNITGVTLAQEFGIPLTDDMTIENMTAQQVSALTDIASKKSSMIREMIQR